MRWAVAGASGMLGSDAVRVLGERGHEVTSLSRAELDITDEAAVLEAVENHDVVMNCAAWTAVDDAEDEEGAAFRANAVGPSVLARACRVHGSRLVQVSTDYVFGGTATVPYESESALDPRSAYGRTKAAGEWAVRAEHPDGHFIVRTAWLYGAMGACFPKTIARLARERGGIAVVQDQVGQPTWTVDVARFVADLLSAGAPSGTYHATAQGQASWYAFAQEVCASAGLGRGVVRPTTSDAFPRPAARPAFSVLSHDAATKAGVASIGDWRARWTEAAREVLSEEGARAPTS